MVEIEAKPVPPSQPAGAKKDKEEVPNSPALLTTPTKMTEMPPALLAAFKAAEIVNRTVGTNTGVNVQKIMEDLKKRFGEPVINTQQSSEAPKEDVSNPGFAYEIEINDYPQKARWKVTNKVSNRFSGIGLDSNSLRKYSQSLSFCNRSKFLKSRRFPGQPSLLAVHSSHPASNRARANANCICSLKVKVRW